MSNSEQAKTPHETTATVAEMLDYFVPRKAAMRDAILAIVADLSARLRAREQENQELKDMLARRDITAKCERQPAASTDRGDL